MTNPFDDPDGTFLVLVNAAGQYSLWPGFAEVPGGWSVAHPAGPRDAALAFVEERWTRGLHPGDLVPGRDGVSG